MIQRTKIHGDIFPIPDDKAMVAQPGSGSNAQCRTTRQGCKQTCTSQRLKLYCFGELPDVVCPKIAQKSQN